MESTVLLPSTSIFKASTLKFWQIWLSMITRFSISKWLKDPLNVLGYIQNSGRCQEKDADQFSELFYRFYYATKKSSLIDTDINLSWRVLWKHESIKN